MKRFVLLLMLLCLALPAQAQILPPEGPAQMGIPAVVLCQSLTVREEPRANARAVGKLRYGDTFCAQHVADGWADVFPGENEPCMGYVMAEFLAIDPAWYVTEGATPVWAWGEAGPDVPKVALLDGGTKLPILKDTGDWLVVSLRGAAGWIQKTAAERTAAVLDIPSFAQAELHTLQGVYVLTQPDSLRRLQQLLASAQPIQTPKCPFLAQLVLRAADGQAVTVDVASDSCPNLRDENGQYWQYEGRASGLWQLFGLNIIQ